MKNIFLSVVVVATLIAAGVGGTFAGFVDTEISEGNFVEAGISDLLVNGKNDPIGPKIRFVHVAPCKSIDFWIDLYNWGECQGGEVYMHFKDIVSEEDGTKTHVDPATGNSAEWVYDGTTVYGMGIPDGYRIAVGAEPVGAGVWSSEPEKISEVGDGMVAQYYIPSDHPCLLGEDYASGIADHLGVNVRVPLKGATGDELGNPDTDGDGVVSDVEEAAWTAAGNRWVIIASLSGKLADIECTKNYLGFLRTQEMTFVHVDVHLQQIECPDWPDEQTKYWPTNALQGDIATWSMMWELITDP